MHGAGSRGSCLARAGRAHAEIRSPHSSHNGTRVRRKRTDENDVHWRGDSAGTGYNCCWRGDPPSNSAYEREPLWAKWCERHTAPLPLGHPARRVTHLAREVPRSSSGGPRAANGTPAQVRKLLAKETFCPAAREACARAERPVKSLSPGAPDSRAWRGGESLRSLVRTPRSMTLRAWRRPWASASAPAPASRPRPAANRRAPRR